MKPEHRRYILAHRGEKSAAQLASDLKLKERMVRRFLELEDRRKKKAPSPSPALAPPGKKKLWLSILLIVCMGAAVYANTPQGEFLWDDSHLVEENRYIRSWKHVPKMFTSDIGAGGDNSYRFYRPFQILTYYIDYLFTKTDPAGYHIGSVLWHILVALALFWLLQVLFKDHLLALISSLLFVVHPVHTEAVTYISGRADPLSTFFIFLTFIFYFKAAESRRMPLFLLALLSYVGALFSRETALIAPVLLLLTHYALRKKVSWPRFLSVTALAALYIIARFTLLSHMLNYKAHSTTVFDRFPGFMAALVLYVRVLFLPVHLHMEYGGWPHGWGHLFVLVGLGVLSGLLIVLFKEKDRRGLVFFSLAWFLLALLPVSNLYPLNAFMAEHWLYLPSVGFFLIIARWFAAGIRREKTKVPALVGLVVLTGCLGVLTFRQSATWLKPIPFFHRLLRYAPHSSRGHNSLGMAYNSIGEYDTGVSYLERAVELSSGAAQRDAVKAYNNLALTYNKLGRNDEAAQVAQGALSMDATHAKAHNNLAISLVRLGKYEKAIEACRKALAQKPGYAKAYNTMAAAYMNMERYEDAVAHYNLAIENAPDYPEAHNNLGLVYQRTGRVEEAISEYALAISLRPDYANAYNNLANAYGAAGMVEDAEAAYRKVIALEPDRATAYLSLASIVFQRAEYKQAVVYHDRAKELGAASPAFSEALEPYR